MSYVYPIGPGLGLGRIDEGVDWSGSGPLYAMGTGVITSVYDAGWPGGVWIGLLLTDPGIYSGRTVYYAENIAPAVSVGEHVHGGQEIGWARGYYPFIEVGWGTGQRGIAAAAYHYTEGVPTPEGQNFLAVLEALHGGGPLPGPAGGVGGVVGSEPGISGQLAPAVSAMGTLARSGLPGSGRLVGVRAAAARRMYTG